MSFSSEARMELTRIVCHKPCCQTAELIGVMLIAGSLHLMGHGEFTVTITTENAAAAKRFYAMLRNRYNIEPTFSATQKYRLGKKSNYVLTISHEDAARVLTEMGLVKKLPALTFDPGVPQKAIAKDCCRRAFLRGSFLGGGSLSNPEKEYHIEFVCARESVADSLCNIISKYDLSAKVVSRKGMSVVYLKESEHIVSLLSILGAHEALLQLENVRIVKDIRNNVNRVINFESANIDKTISASGRQADSIEYIVKTSGLNILPPTLREIAEVRMNNRDATLVELGEMLHPPVGKSGVNHRLRRIDDIAKELKAAKGE